MRCWYTYVFLLMICGVSGCCKDDPCSGVKETKAYFEGYSTTELEEWRRIGYPLIDNDTNWSHMTFVAFDIEEAISYKWIIGAEEIENKPIVYREDFPLNVPVPISLIVRKNPNKSCYPKDDGIDTLTKIYYFTDNDWRWYRADGSYLYFRGSFAKKPKDSFTFHISADRDLRINRFDTLFDYPCKGDKILYYMDRTKYNSFFGRTNIGGQKYVCDTIHNFFFSYLKTGNGVYMKSYIKLGRDSVVFNGYQIK